MIGAKKPTSMDDIADAITALATHMDKRFDAVELRLDRIEARLDAVEARLDSLESTISSHTHQLTNIENRLKNLEGSNAALENDVKEVYAMLSDVHQDIKQKKITDQKVLKRVQNLEQFADLVAKQTGIAFK